MTTAVATPGTTTALLSPTPLSPTPSVAAQIDQGRARRLLDRALTLSQQGERPSAIVACRQAVSLAPHEASGYSILGMLLEQTGDTQGAIAAYEKVIDLTADCEAERESLDRLYAISRQRLAAGMQAGESEAATSNLSASPTVIQPSVALEQNALQPELPAPSALGAPLEPVTGRHSTFHTRVLPLLIVSAVSLVAVVWAKRVAQPLTGQPLTAQTAVAQTPATLPAGRSVSAPALSAPQNTATGATNYARDNAPDTATGTATMSTAKTDRSPLKAPSSVRVRVANAPIQAPSRSSSLAPRPDQGSRASASGATQAASQPAQSPGTGVAPASSQPHSVTTGTFGATDAHGGGVSPNGKPFNPNGSGSKGYIRINPYEDAAR